MKRIGTWLTLANNHESVLQQILHTPRKLNTLNPNPTILGGQVLIFWSFLKTRPPSCLYSSTPFPAFIAPIDSTHECSMQPQTVPEKPHEAPVTSKFIFNPKGGSGFLRCKGLRMLTSVCQSGSENNFSSNKQIIR